MCCSASIKAVGTKPAQTFMKKSILATLCLVSLLGLFGCAKDGLSDESLPPFAAIPEMCPYEGGDCFDHIEENAFVNVAENPVSAFSVDVDGASYTIMRKMIQRYKSGCPLAFPMSSVRIEEYLNYFKFDYPEPSDGSVLAADAEMVYCPWDSSHLLLRLGLKGQTVSESKLPKSNYVFLVDVSGSMASPDKLDLLKSGLVRLLANLQPDDRVSIVTYSGNVEKILESTPVSESSVIRSAILSLTASGITRGGDALEMAYEEALANFVVGGNNRVVMGTDGDFNVGVTDTKELTDMVRKYASRGIYLTVCGFGLGNLNDAMMESISNHGNGTYEYIDSEEEMVRVFVDEVSKFHTVASDCKVRVTFNPALVSSYRLIGYENRRISSAAYDDESTDAGDIGSGQTITALYELLPTSESIPTSEFLPTSEHLPTSEFFSAASSDSSVVLGSSVAPVLGTFEVRYKEIQVCASQKHPTQGLTAREISIPLPSKPADTMSANMSFAAGVASYGMLMKNSQYKGNSTFDTASELVRGGLSFDPKGYRAQLLSLIQTAKSIERY